MLAFTALRFASPQDRDDDPATPAAASEPGGGHDRPMQPAEIEAMAQPSAQVRRYRLFLQDAAGDATEDTWTDREGHTVELTGDRLFVDDAEIDPCHFQWSADRTTLRWCQGRGDHHLGGELAFDGHGYRAAGSVAFGDRSSAAH